MQLNKIKGMAVQKVQKHEYVWRVTDTIGHP